MTVIGFNVLKRTLHTFFTRHSDICTSNVKETLVLTWLKSEAFLEDLRRLA